MHSASQRHGARRPRAAHAPLIGRCGHTSGMKRGEKSKYRKACVARRPANSRYALILLQRHEKSANRAAQCVTLRRLRVDACSNSTRR